MAHGNRITVSKLNPNLGEEGEGVILPPLPFGVPLITQKR